MLTAVVAGHLCVDLTPALHREADVTPGGLVDVGPLRLEPGGCVANTASALHALGVPVRLAADVGDDELGRVLRRLLAARGLDTGGLRIVPGGTTSYSVVIQGPGRDRTFWHHTGANAHFDGRGLVLDGGGVLHCGYPSLLPSLTAEGGMRLCALLDRSRAAGLTTSLDLAVIDPSGDAGRLDWAGLLASFLRRTDVFTPSVADLTSALGRGIGIDPDALSREAGALVAQGAALVMLTAGPAGLVLRTGTADRLREGGRILAALPQEWAERELWVPSLAAERIRTTGAGDAATAGLLYGLVAGLQPESALVGAAATAALSLSGRSPLPRYQSPEITLQHIRAPDHPGWGRGARGVFTGPGDRPRRGDGDGHTSSGSLARPPEGLDLTPDPALPTGLPDGPTSPVTSRRT